MQHRSANARARGAVERADEVIGMTTIEGYLNLISPPTRK
jgi:hypothetical protein